MHELRRPSPALADDLIRLRAWAEADLRPAMAAKRDPDVLRFTRVPERETEDDHRAFVARQESERRAGETLSFVVADAASDAFLGTISLLRFDWASSRGEIGYWLAPSARGRGVAVRAVRLLAPWAFTELGLARIDLLAAIDNDASQRVAERSGFVREGVLRSYEEHRGERRDLVIFSLLPSDRRGPKRVHDH